MAESNEQDPNLIRADDFEGELDEKWHDAKGRRVLDKSGDEVGTVEELYVWEEASTVHLIRVSGGERHFLVPVHAVTSVSEEGVEVEESKQRIMESPEFDSDNIPDPDTRRATYAHYGYPDPLDLGGG